MRWGHQRRGDGPIQTVALHTEGRAARCSYASPTCPTTWARPRPAPTSTWPSWNAPCSSPARTRSGPLRLRRQDPASRRPLRPARSHVHRPQRRGDAQARRQDRLEAHRRGGRRTVAPWSRGAVETLDGALAAADAVGYPLMLKATAGGGGRGIRMVASAADLKDAYQRTSDEALRAFGNGTVVPGAPGHRSPARRGASHRRQPRHRLGDPGSATAPSSAATRRSSRKSASPLLTPAQTDELKPSRPSGWRSPSDTSAPAP